MWFAGTASSRKSASEKKPWYIPPKRTWLVGTPSAASRAVYASPSSRNGSNSAVITIVGGDAATASSVGEMWRQPRVAERARIVAGVVADEPRQALGREHRSGGVLDVARKAAGEVGGRIHEQLVSQRHGLRVADDDGQVGPGGVTADRQPIGIAPEVRGMLRSPRVAASASSTAAGNGCSGCQSVVDAEHGVTAAVGQDAAQVVVRVDVADDPAASMEEHQQTELRVVARAIEPGPARPRHRYRGCGGSVPSTGAGGWLGSPGLGPACTLQCRLAELRHEVEDRLGLRMQRHGPIVTRPLPSASVSRDRRDHPIRRGRGLLRVAQRRRRSSRRHCTRPAVAALRRGDRSVGR